VPGPLGRNSQIVLSSEADRFGDIARRCRKDDGGRVLVYGEIPGPPSGIETRITGENHSPLEDGVKLADRIECGHDSTNVF
jgi:hypothetical protein